MKRMPPLAAAAALIAALAAALLTPGPAAAGISTAALTIKPSADSVRFNRTVELSGRLTTGGAPPASPADREVVLRATPFPYEAEQVIATARTDAQGRYTFGDVPVRLNTVFRVTVADGVSASSPEAFVVSKPKVKTGVEVGRNARVTTSLSVRYPAELPTRLDDRKVFWYFRKVSEKKWDPVERSRTRKAAEGKVEAKATFKAPPGDYRFATAYCLEVPNIQDIGVWAPVDDPRCPRKPFKRFGREAARTARLAVPAGA